MAYEPARPMKVHVAARSPHTAATTTPRNHHNPAPGAEVRFGPQSVDEMYIPFLEVSVDAENLRQRLDESLQ